MIIEFTPLLSIFSHQWICLSVVASLIAFQKNRNQLLPTLIALESAVLLLSALAGQIYSSSFIIILILVFGACEASLGLALLVAITRTVGSDNVPTTFL